MQTRTKGWVSNGRVSAPCVWLCEDCLRDGKRTELRPNKRGGLLGLCQEHISKRVEHFWQVWESEQN